MPIRLQVTTFTDPEKFAPIFTEIPNLPIAVLRRAIDRWRPALRSRILAKLANGQPLGLRSGRLFSWAAKTTSLTVKDQGRNTIVVEANEPPEYAGIHETGGKISAAGGKGYLAIPTQQLYARTPKGKDPTRLPLFKNTVLQGTEQGYTVWWVQRKKITGKTWNIKAAARSGKLPMMPIYLLRKTVTVPARPWFWPAVEEAIPELSALAEEEKIAYLNELEREGKPRRGGRTRRK